MKYKELYLQLKNYLSKIYSGNKTELQNSIQSLSNPTKIIVILKPFLIRNYTEFTNSYLTGITNVDNTITNRISEDYTKIKNILPFYFESAYYWYDGGLDKNQVEKNMDIIITDYKFENGLIYLTVCKSNNHGFNKSDYRAVRICFDPYNFGPDAYMLQDITIYQGPELEDFLKDGDNHNLSVELAVDVIDILPHLK